ncbi:thioredoxin reductase (NADPH) [Agromyces flavus]|uniref:Thioredoxin reductase (NADPH) n=1 Tax=Agromyces flavus TaxID=589382 RepID=A0A1H1ZK00_9MICO|nr:cyclic nucleotide-binding domain-containing thioredoxin-disulfide reductase [Agromyces flavus]MCP2367113.1 thioredoxin reductase (NADPH) [Agromyces flavus]GGI46374.1 thioredoxin reductase [Agromyces flavus]SDT33556.1 thioredoxin reductase (NADPH) [Agromyces flavus]
MGHHAGEKITPELTDAQWDRLRGYGTPQQTDAGQVLFRAGDRSYDLILVETGEVEVVREALWWTEEEQLAVLGPRTFVGELGLLNGQRAFLTARAMGPGRILRIDHDSLQRMMAEDDELCDLMLRTLWARREMLRQGPAAWTLKIVGSSSSAESTALRRYAERLELVHTFVDVDDPNLDHNVWGHGYTREDIPIAIVQGEIVRNATPGQLAELLGLAYASEDDIEFDLAVVGAGPAGLAAAIYGASEGLRTVLLDAVAPGGQSATTSRIENYLGFPFGVSGDALTSQASLQAFKFGVRIAAPCPVVRLDAETGVHRLLLADGKIVRARAVVVTTGVAYRGLPLDRWDEFEGHGIHHAASELELRQVAGEDVVVVGGANSAGQAALGLAGKGCHVRLVIRSGDMSERMSSYLVDRIRDDSRIEVRTATEVAGLHGGDRLERVTLRGPAGEEVVDGTALFCFIGAVPATDWLVDLERDPTGFVHTGADVLALGDDWRELDRMPLPFETSVPRVFAAGDVRRGSMKRVAAAVGEGSSAVASVHRALAAMEVFA